MTGDPRETPFDGRIAHVSLRGRVAAEHFTEGVWKTVTVPRLPLFASPGGGMERELVLGDRFCVISEHETGEGFSFGFAERDGYCGYIARSALGTCLAATHWVSVRTTCQKSVPDLKAYEELTTLSFGSRVAVTGTEGSWSAISRIVNGADRQFFVPTAHIRPVGDTFDDPVDAARLFLGTPYVWGGNSGEGIDCSGLVQAAILACGVPCPGDSDQQRHSLGDPLEASEGPRRGDLYFWAGHVGLLSDDNTLLHASAHHMAVAEEPLEVAIARILSKDSKPVLMRRRVTPPRG